LAEGGNSIAVSLFAVGIPPPRPLANAISAGSIIATSITTLSRQTTILFISISILLTGTNSLLPY
jgi:hypothetical protein